MALRLHLTWEEVLFLTHALREDLELRTYRGDHASEYERFRNDHRLSGQVLEKVTRLRDRYAEPVQPAPGDEKAQ